MKKSKAKRKVTEVRRKVLPQDLPDRRVVSYPLTQQYNGQNHVMMQVSLRREPWISPGEVGHA